MVEARLWRMAGLALPFAILLAGCSRLQSLTPGERVTPGLSQVDPEFSSRDLSELQWDLRDGHLVVVNPRPGHLLLWEDGKGRRLDDERLLQSRAVWFEKKNEAEVVTVQEDIAQVTLWGVRNVGSKNLALERVMGKAFALPPRAQDDDATNQAHGAGGFQVSQVRPGEKKKVLALARNREDWGLLVFNRGGGRSNVNWHSFPESLRAPTGTFKFQKFMLGSREEIVYAVHVSSSRRGIERTQVTRFEPQTGKIYGRVVYRCHPAQLFEIFDDAEAIFSTYDEGENEWVFEHRHLDADRVRTHRVLRLTDHSPVRVQNFGNAYGGILLEKGAYTFCLYR